MPVLNVSLGTSNILENKPKCCRAWDNSKNDVDRLLYSDSNNSNNSGWRIFFTYGWALLVMYKITKNIRKKFQLVFFSLHSVKGAPCGNFPPVW